MTWWWWIVNLGDLYRAFQAVQRGQCYVAFFDYYGVLCVNKDEYDKLLDEARRESGQAEEEQKMVSRLVDEIQEVQVEQSARQRQPKAN